MVKKMEKQLSAPDSLRSPGARAYRPYSHLESTGAEKRVVFEVENNWTWITVADPFLLHVFDQEARYETPVATAKEAGFITPDEMPGAWDGWIRMLRRSKTMPPKIPTGLLPMLMRIAEKFGYDPEVLDKRVRPEEGFPELKPVPLRDYQQSAVEAGEREGRGVFDLPPRSGKTRAMMELQRRIALPTIWIAPTDRIVRQTQGVLEDWYGKNYSMHLIGTKEIEAAMKMQVVICTAATAAMLPEEFFQTRGMIVVDEWHHGAAKTYREIFKKCDHIYYRFGMTGTFFRSGGDGMAMHALLSNTIFKVSSRELLARGYLVPTSVLFLPVLAPKLRGVPNTFQTGHGKFGIQEHRERNLLVTQVVTLLQKSGRKVLVLVGTKKQGRTLAAMINGFVKPTPDSAEFKSVEFVSTDTPRPIQTRIIDSFTDTDEVKVLIGTSLVGEGVDLPTTDALVYARGEKAEVTLAQNAYRVCTAIEGKRDAIIVDFADRHHKKLLSHSMERMAVYHRDPVFDVEVLPTTQSFVDWMASKSLD